MMIRKTGSQNGGRFFVHYSDLIYSTFLWR